MEYVIDKLRTENNEILQRRTDLKGSGDFTIDGDRLLKNQLFIEKLQKLPIRLVEGNCNCGNRIIRDDIIVYCAYCHKEIG